MAASSSSWVNSALLQISATDIEKVGTGNTWDGTNTSLQTSISAINASLVNKTALTSSTHTVSGYYSQIGKVVTVNGWFTFTNSTNEVKLNLPTLLVDNVPVPYINISNPSNRGVIYATNSNNNCIISTYLASGMNNGNEIHFAFSYIVD